MMLKEKELYNHVKTHSPKWTTYNMIKFKQEMLDSVRLIDDQIKISKRNKQVRV